MGEMVSAIKLQLQEACRGKREAIEELQTKSGVKDKTVQYWINVILARAQQMQKCQFYGNAKERDARMSDARQLKGDTRKQMKETITDEIQEEIHDWLVQQPPDSFAVLPENSCEWFHNFPSNPDTRSRLAYHCPNLTSTQPCVRKYDPGITTMFFWVYQG